MTVTLQQIATALGALIAIWAIFWDYSEDSTVAGGPFIIALLTLPAVALVVLAVTVLLPIIGIAVVTIAVIASLVLFWKLLRLIPWKSVIRNTKRGSSTLYSSTKRTSKSIQKRVTVLVQNKRKQKKDVKQKDNSSNKTSFSTRVQQKVMKSVTSVKKAIMEKQSSARNRKENSTRETSQKNSTAYQREVHTHQSIRKRTGESTNYQKVKTAKRSLRAKQSSASRKKLLLSTIFSKKKKVAEAEARIIIKQIYYPNVSGLHKNGRFTGSTWQQPSKSVPYVQHV